jgi:hypothetical protein
VGAFGLNVAHASLARSITAASNPIG